MISAAQLSPLWFWSETTPAYILLPWATRMRGGEALSTNVRGRMAKTREKRREAMYEAIRDLYGNDNAGWKAREARLTASIAALHQSRSELRVPSREEVERVGGPVAWQYLTPRVDKMWTRGEITTAQMKAAVCFCFWYRLGWVMRAPGTNMVKSEKVDGGYNGTRVRSGAMFPIHELLPIELKVLEAALIREVGFKDLPASLGVSRITRHRSGKAAFISALCTFDRVNQSLLTK